MSRVADEKQGQKKRASGAGKGKEVHGGFYTFHPTEAEKKAIKAMDTEMEAHMELLGDYASRGIDFKLTRNSSDNAFCLVARERSAEFGTGTALSVFHANMSTLLALMFYALTVKFPHYPEQALTATQQEFDW